MRDVSGTLVMMPKNYQVIGVGSNRSTGSLTSRLPLVISDSSMPPWNEDVCLGKTSF